MTNVLNKFQLWILRKLLFKLMQQGRHEQGINKIFTEIILTYNEIFTEDNIPTRNEYLKELLDKRLQKISK